MGNGRDDSELWAEMDEELEPCPLCECAPGSIHFNGCWLERCSVCLQYNSDCSHLVFPSARWLWSGHLSDTDLERLSSEQKVP